MKIADPVKKTVFIQGRGLVRLLEAMAEAGVPYTTVGFPARSYERSDGITLVCGRTSRPYEVIRLVVGSHGNNPDEGAPPPRVGKREPIPFVEIFEPLYSYRRGILRPFWARGREMPPIMPQGFKILEVLGRGHNPQYLRVRLPHRQEEWLLHQTVPMWLQRVPTPLELRLQTFWLDNPYGNDTHHPLWAAEHLREQARRERWLLAGDGSAVGVLAAEEWEELRQNEGLSVDEALIAVQEGLLASVEDRGTLYRSGPFHGKAVETYISGRWHWGDSTELLRQMTDLHTLEREMLRGAMRAVGRTRTLYAWESIQKLSQ